MFVPSGIDSRKGMAQHVIGIMIRSDQRETNLQWTRIHLRWHQADENMKTKKAAKAKTGEATVAELIQKLERETARRGRAENSLIEYKLNHIKLLEEARSNQLQLKKLSHGILLAQEDERKRISRELHDQIGQALGGIHFHLTALKAEGITNTAKLNRNIERTRRLVEKSVKLVHKFAVELRPAALDELGLIPALHAYLKNFGERTHIQIVINADAGIEEIDLFKKTVLFRVTQEALTNIATHANAGKIKLVLKRTSNAVELKVSDDGRSFQVEKTLASKRNKCLGLLGMRERVEMVGGTFAIQSAPGSGTTIHVTIPIGDISQTKKSSR